MAQVIRCRQCGRETHSAGSKKYCSGACQRRAQGERWKAANPPIPAAEWDLPSTTVGMIHQMVVEMDLMRKGKSVFRAVNDSGCDLVVVDGNVATRIEVTTGHRSTGGTLQFQKHKSRSGKFDVLAVVTRDGVITYIPKIE